MGNKRSGDNMGTTGVNEAQGRRRKAVVISSQLLQLLFTTDNEIHAKCVEGLPASAQLVGHGYDHRIDVHYLVFESAEWDTVDFGEQLPHVHVKYVQYQEHCSNCA